MTDPIDAFFAAHSFDRWMTGGGCTAYGRKLSEDGDRYIQITGDETCACPADERERCFVYFYDQADHIDGDGGEADGIADAIALAMKLMQKHGPA